MRTRVGRTEEELIAAMGEQPEARVADVVERLRSDQLQRLLAMSPGERLDRAFALMELAHDLGAARGVRQH